MEKRTISNKISPFLTACVIVVFFMCALAVTDRGANKVLSGSQLIERDSLIDLATKVVKSEKGFRSKSYLDSDGGLSIDYGYSLSKNEGLGGFNFSIDTSTAKGIVKLKLINLNSKLLKNNMAYTRISRERKAVLLSMAYQIGYKELHKFTKMWKALDDKDYYLAGAEVLDSLWAKQTPARAKRHAKSLESGHIVWK